MSMDEDVFSENKVDTSENVARYIFQKAYYRSSDNTVKYNAFMPNKNGLTSVYRTIGLEDGTIFDLGREYVTNPLKKELIGRADISVSEILKRELNVMPDPIPHKRHANICDYPNVNSEQKAIALELAAEANLILI